MRIPAKSIIADCHAISDPALALDASWETLYGTYGYVTTNVASQLATISNKGAVELSESGLRELVADLYICQVKATTHDPRALDNESFLCAFAKRLPLPLQGELAMKIADADPRTHSPSPFCCISFILGCAYLAPVRRHLSGV